MATTVKKVVKALEREGLRDYVDAIDRGEDGEVILWHAGGYPVSSVREAVALARDFRASYED